MRLVILAALSASILSTNASAKPFTAGEVITISKIDADCKQKFPEPSLVAKIWYGSGIVLERRRNVHLCMMLGIAKAKMPNISIVPTGNN